MKLIDENRYADEMREMVLPALATCRSEGWMAPADDDGLPPLQRAGKLHYVCYDAAKFDRLGEDGAAATFRGAVVISTGSRSSPRNMRRWCGTSCSQGTRCACSSTADMGIPRVTSTIRP